MNTDKSRVSTKCKMRFGQFALSDLRLRATPSAVTCRERRPARMIRPGDFRDDAWMGAMALSDLSLFALDCCISASRHVIRPDPDALLAWPSPLGGRSSNTHFHHTLCQRPSGVCRLSGNGRQQHAVLSDTDHPGGWRSVFCLAVQSICRDGVCQCGVVLRACLYRQGISRRGIEFWNASRGSGASGSFTSPTICMRTAISP